MAKPLNKPIRLNPLKHSESNCLEKTPPNQSIATKRKTNPFSAQEICIIKPVFKTNKSLKKMNNEYLTKTKCRLLN